MRTLMFIAGGVLLWAIITGLSRAMSSQATGGWTPMIVFAVIWFCIAAWNMWVGVTQAGYSLMEELPIFFVLYLVPLGIAALIKWKILD
ncbi:MAG: hypothetical protein ABW096_09350 [Candidatus Thiodiazotropha sp.]